jgi:MFS family permease
VVHALTGRQEFARGYKVLLAAVLGSGTGVAVLVAYGIGAFVSAFERDYGWTRAEVTAAPLCFAIGVLLAGAGAGALADRYGARRVALISQLLLAAGFAAMSRLGPQLWTFYAAYLLLPMVAAGTLPMTWTRAVIGWFVASRGLALGMSLIATGLVGALLPSYLSWLIGIVGWRGAYLGLAIVPLVVGMPLALLYFREPDEVPATGASASAAAQRARVPIDAGSFLFSAAVRTRSFWQLSASFLLAAICVGAVLTHAIPLLMGRGFSAPAAAAIAGLFGMAVTCARLISGLLLDRYSGPRVAAVMFGGGALACALLVYAGDNRVLCGLAIVLVGLAAGGEADIGAYVAARYFGRAHYGAIYGLFYTIYCLGGGIGPMLAGVAYDRSGSYQTSLYTGVAGFALAAVMAVLLQAPRSALQADHAAVS